MKIFLALPNLGEIATGNVNNLIAWKSDPTLDIELFMPEGIIPGSRARNVCHKAFLESDCDVLFMLDERTVPAPWYLDKLLGRNKDVVAACVQTMKLGRENEPYLCPLGFRWNNDLNGYQPTFSIGLTQVNVASCACMVVRREVMENVRRPAFETTYEGEFGEQGITCDFDFCEKVKEAGYDIWMDYDILCRHFQRLETKNFNKMLHCTARRVKGERDGIERRHNV